MSKEIVPFITLREGEEQDLSKLAHWSDGSGLGYTDERPHQDRDHQKVLWTRFSQPMPVDAPTGDPLWKKIHPARTPAGFIFLNGLHPGAKPSEEGVIITQPPVCPRDAFVSAKRCDHLYKNEFQVLLLERPRLYGVTSHLYTLAPAGGLIPAPGATTSRRTPRCPTETHACPGCSPPNSPAGSTRSPPCRSATCAPCSSRTRHRERRTTDGRHIHRFGPRHPLCSQRSWRCRNAAPPRGEPPRG